LVAGQFSGKMSVYAIDPASGKLQKTDQCAVGVNPNWIEILDVG
jgi:6-phosphogluconolactonase